MGLTRGKVYMLRCVAFIPYFHFSLIRSQFGVVNSFSGRTQEERGVAGYYRTVLVSYHSRSAVYHPGRESLYTSLSLERVLERGGYGILTLYVRKRIRIPCTARLTLHLIHSREEGLRSRTQKKKNKKINEDLTEIIEKR